MEQDMILITINAKFVLVTAGALFSIISFLIVLLGKLVINGINNTITSCHGTLDANAKHSQEMNDRVHANFETRMGHLESAVFKPIGSRND